MSAPTGRWRFAEEKYALNLRTVGGGPVPEAGKAPVPTFNTNGQFGIFRDPSPLPYVANCAANAPGLLVVEEVTLARPVRRRDLPGDQVARHPGPALVDGAEAPPAGQDGVGLDELPVVLGGPSPPVAATSPRVHAVGDQQRRADHEREAARREGLVLDEIAINGFRRKAA